MNKKMYVPKAPGNGFTLSHGHYLSRVLRNAEDRSGLLRMIEKYGPNDSRVAGIVHLVDQFDLTVERAEHYYGKIRAEAPHDPSAYSAYERKVLASLLAEAPKKYGKLRLELIIGGKKK